MSEKITRDERIDGRKYHIVYEETKRSKRVSVYKHSVMRRYRQDDNDIVYDKRYKGSLLWFGEDTTPPRRKMVRDAVSEAVSIVKSENEKKDSIEESVAGAVDDVRVVHDDSEDL